MRGPIPYTPLPVTTLALATYLIIPILLFLIHVVPPRNIPSSSSQDHLSISVPEAWRDLEYLTESYHPYNSRANDQVRSFLRKRIDEILEKNQGGAKTTVYDDMSSNVTFAAESSHLSVYYEGTNIVVVVEGSYDKKQKIGGVLVNAHYDSVATGFGATDNGVGVVSVLQLISHFTSPDTKRPKRDIVFLLNNGEEDYLNGARAYAVSPWANSARIFYNLEGAGGGGRAMLFRSTDTEVTKFYQGLHRPFGSSISADGFKKGLIRSQTDYKVFVEDMGMRGLDVAFWTPRSRYHTQDDDVRHTSRESVWHMLGGAITAVEAMAQDTSNEFAVPFEEGSESAWFDIFGRAFVLLKLHTLFAITVTLLVTTPLALFITIIVLVRANKFYLFSNESVLSKPTHGWKGVLAFPITFLIATGSTIATTYLLVKVNPMIVYGHLYTVYIVFASIWLLTAWITTSFTQWLRPSALTRAYTYMWLWLGWWAFLAYTAVVENNKHITGTYWVMFFYAASFLGFWISLLEMFALPAKDTGKLQESDATEPLLRSSGQQSETYVDGTSVYPAYGAAAATNGGNHTAGTSVGGDTDTVIHTPPTEGSPLLGNSRRGSITSGGRSERPWRFRRYQSQDVHVLEHNDSDTYSINDSLHNDDRTSVYGHEQRWSKHLPVNWGTWVLQWLISVPVPIILIGQVALLMGGALGMTGADGSDILTVYLALAVTTVLFLLPIAPFLPRLMSHYVFLVSAIAVVVSVLFALTAFPFTSTARLKVYFQQSIDLDAPGYPNTVSLVGIQPYVRQIIETEFPSAYGQELNCTEDWNKRGLARCLWTGLTPKVARGEPKEWVEVKAKKVTETKGYNSTQKKAVIEVYGKDTRACKLIFDKPVVSLTVSGISRPTQIPTPTSTVTATRVPTSTFTSTSSSTSVEKTTFTIPISTRTAPGYIPPVITPTTLAAEPTLAPESSIPLHAQGEYRPPLNERSPIPPGGTKELRLWRREWGAEAGWRVEVGWEEADNADEKEKGLSGRVVCLWSDVNEKGTVPAWDEVLAVSPRWVAVSKLADGIVEGSKGWKV